MKPELEALLNVLKDADENPDVDVKVFGPLDVEEEPSKEALAFEAGINEAVKRLLRKHDDYGLIKMVRTILDVELEEKDE